MRLPRLSPLLLAFSCASQPHRPAPSESIVDQVEEERISVMAVLDLARNSYLKGCVDGKNLFASKIAGSAFEKCRDMGIEHQEEIRHILEQNVDRSDSESESALKLFSHP